MHRLISFVGFCSFLFILWMIYLANTGGNSIFFNVVVLIPYGDKIGHMGLFGLLCFMAIIGSKFQCFSFYKFRFYYGAVVVTLFAVLEELSQIFIPSRTFDLVDVLASGIGIVCAIGLSYLLDGSRKR